ncbi:WG repeat-containing protein [Xanthomonas translucens]|uniref:WG repeat-containing protein n=3 Tax=Xanthomonas campestris pv. translucens TaxID=343 RepID=UPI001F284D61|nr:WG repeat-containing protein [Xanthomonas translucens]UJB16354.1 WG repeat-containing protein [Xanthomonas translucens pv. undulosa]
MSLARQRHTMLARRRAAALVALAALAAAPAAWAQADGACRIADPNSDRAIVPGCSVAADGRLRLSPQTAQRLQFDADGLSVLTVGDQFYYVRADGSSLPVILWDSGPDYFAEGLTRGIVHGCIGFYDRQLREVIPPVHDFAWPFENGVARVCDHCRRGTPDGDGHTPMEGGRWYAIDRNNREVPEPRP